MGYKEIKPLELEKLLSSGNLIVLDIRALSSYSAGHIPGAVHLTMPALQEFCKQSDKQSAKILVYCYHGISSQSVAQYLIEQGFAQVYSLSGGYEEWQQQQLHSATASEKT